MKVTQLVLILASLLMGSTVLAQPVKPVKYKFWNKKIKVAQIPEEFQDADAVNVTSSYLIQNFFEISGSYVNFGSVQTVRKRIHIQTEQGIEEYSNLTFRQIPGEKINFLDARTIKKEGKYIPIGKEDIKLITRKDPYSDASRRYYQIAMPDVQVGDEVEFIYSIEDNELSLGDRLYLNDELPTMRKDIIINTQRGLVLKFEPFNDAPKYQRKEYDDRIELVWTARNLKGSAGQKFAILSNEMAGVDYYLYMVDLGYGNPQYLYKNDWKEVAGLYNYYMTDGRQERGLKEFIDALPMDKSITGVEKVKAVIRWINENVTVNENLPDDNGRLFTDYLQSGEIDNASLSRLYIALFQEMNVKQELCLARNRYAGGINTMIPSPLQITHVLFRLTDASRATTFIYSSSRNKNYAPGEIPFFLEGAAVMFADITDPKNIEVKAGRLPFTSPRDNTIKRTFRVETDLESEQVSISYRHFLSGVPSSLYRDDWREVTQRKDTSLLREVLEEQVGLKASTAEIPVISVDENEDPYRFSLDVALTASMLTSPIDEGTYGISLTDFLQNEQIQLSRKDRWTDYYPPCSYTDEAVVMLVVPEGFTLANLETLNDSFENKVGLTQCQVAQVEEQVFMVSLTYALKQNYVTKSQLEELDELNGHNNGFREQDFYLVRQTE